MISLIVFRALRKSLRKSGSVKSSWNIVSTCASYTYTHTHVQYESYSVYTLYTMYMWLYWFLSTYFIDHDSSNVLWTATRNLTYTHIHMNIKCHPPTHTPTHTPTQHIHIYKPHIIHINTYTHAYKDHTHICTYTINLDHQQMKVSQTQRNCLDFHLPLTSSLENLLPLESRGSQQSDLLCSQRGRSLLEIHHWHNLYKKINNE